MREYLIELSLKDIRSLELKARKSKDKKTRLKIQIPDKVPIVAYDSKRGVKGPVTEDPIEIDQVTQTPSTTME